LRCHESASWLLR